MNNDTKIVCLTAKNEIIFGINILRPVRISGNDNTPKNNCCDLISISQVDASILPNFLKERVGTMAVEDFFKNVQSSLLQQKE